MPGSPNSAPSLPNKAPTSTDQRTSLRRRVGCSVAMLAFAGTVGYPVYSFFNGLNETIEAGQNPNARYSASAAPSVMPSKEAPNNKPADPVEDTPHPKASTPEADVPQPEPEYTNSDQNTAEGPVPVPGDGQCWWNETNPQQPNGLGHLYTDSDCGGAGPTVGYRFVNGKEFNTNETKQIPDGTAVDPICEWPNDYIGVNMAEPGQPDDPYFIGWSKLGFPLHGQAL